MNPDEFKKESDSILSNLTNQAYVSESLTKLHDAYLSTHTLNETYKQTQGTHEKEIQALKETNMNLFLKIKTPETQTPLHDISSNNQVPAMTYDNLIKEMSAK